MSHETPQSLEDDGWTGDDTVRLAKDLQAHGVDLLDVSTVGTRRLRLRLFSAAAQLVTTARRRHLRLIRHWPWTVTSAIQRLEAPEPRLTW